MYTWLAIGLVVVAVALALIHYKPANPGPVGVEGFTTTAIHPTRVPECTARSTEAQALLARVANIGGDAADELRLLVSKMCCMEADIATPSAGLGSSPRTLTQQFRTSHDLEPPSSLVGRCLRNAVNHRDIELVIEKFKVRGHDLINALCSDPVAHQELDAVVAKLQLAMTSFCIKAPPRMDRPEGVRDVGFWEADESDLSQYKGISAQPR